MTKETFIKIMDRSIKSLEKDNQYSCLLLADVTSYVQKTVYVGIEHEPIAIDYSNTFEVDWIKSFDDVDNPQNSRLAALELYKEMCLSDKRYLNF